MGYRPTVMPKSRFPGMAEDITTIDFSGWPMIVRADMRDDAAYAICEAIEKRKEVIPTDNYKPLEMAQLCANDEEAPYDVPLHPGAARFTAREATSSREYIMNQLVIIRLSDAIGDGTRVRTKSAAKRDSVERGKYLVIARWMQRLSHAEDTGARRRDRA